MAYFTGTASTPTDLKTLVEAKAILAGWTLTGGWLSKGSSHVQLVATDTGAYPSLTITGANSSDGLTEPAGFTKGIYIVSTAWPVTYYLHLNASPETIVLVVKYSTNNTQMLMFGDMVKIHSSAFVGGNFFHASGSGTTGSSVQAAGLYSLTLDTLQCSTTNVSSSNNGPQIIPFSTCSDASGGVTPPNIYSVAKNGLHVKIDGAIWDGEARKVTYTDTTISSLFRSPNLYNSQTHLVPMNLQYAMADGLYGYLGYLEHIRLVRVDNYEINDTITLSPDTWKIYPWSLKDTIYRNGASGYVNTVGTSGTVGFAVRYTP